MPLSSQDMRTLEAVRQQETVRIEAIRNNDADSMDSILDGKFIYINYQGIIYDKSSYVTAVRTHCLTYSTDIDISETEYRVDGDLVILVGQICGHARLDREQDVYHHKNMRVWRQRGSEWKLLAWQSAGS